MITSITFILDPPLGRYSSGTCVKLLARLPHPAAPSMVAPAAPAPATLRKSLRVRVRSVTPRLRVDAHRASAFSRPPYFCSARCVFSSIYKVFSTESNQPPRIVANSFPLRRNHSPGARPLLPGAVLVNWLVTGGCGFIGTALIRSLMEEGGHTVRVVDNLSVGTREDLAAAW